jgi:hypothetical protein
MVNGNYGIRKLRCNEMDAMGGGGIPDRMPNQCEPLCRTWINPNSFNVTRYNVVYFSV